MLRSETLFGKRETPTPNSPLSATNNLSSNSPSTFPKAGNQVTSTANSMLSTQHSNASSTTEGGSKLIVGPNIKLKGVEITDCDTLVVEGRVEATMNSRVIHIAEKGAFIGSAEIDLAEIHGEFNGDLTVREKLVIYATGKVSGKIRYGKVVIEEGGQLIGEVQVGTAAAKTAPPAAVAAVPSTTV
ncbi:polymer-forming cytoskeletal protein [Glaciimonas sp. PAMC28666]|uniref:bactofilin family protein n=1 Tax=Glaciimonas sp. PAMC28666 TaxID=2807626 RepID=UPI001962F1E3|nr:polymer-forming cytoskeletal protein [Glaciimonas sp. PAMC28666]QRX83394.1 polymer-forming cytoskeletal protein [Glaciimonas sp. PAMC28666]